MNRREFILGAGSGAVLAELKTAQAPSSNAISRSLSVNPGRRRMLFDLDWLFYRGDIEHGERPDLDDRSWKPLNLPHDWAIAGPFDINCPCGWTEAYLPAGIGWYRKTFTLPRSESKRTVRIEFDGVYMNSDAWINGYHMGHRPYGYISFAYDMAPYINWGGENWLAVRVDNSLQPNSRWYTGSGIYRHVWLTITDPVHVDLWGVYVTTPQVNNPTTVEVQTTIVNEQTESAAVQLETLILDPFNKEVASAKLKRTVGGKGRRTFTQRFRVGEPRLWSHRDPLLYTARSVVRSGELLDNCDTRFGIREVKFDADHGFLLNGAPTPLRGVCLHHDLGALGAAFIDAAMERRLQLLKAMGCNAIRTAHNPPAPQLLDMCDRLGFFVMDEAFDEWKVGKMQYGYHLYFDQWAKRDLHDMIVRDRNHPSIVLWSIGNEIPESVRPEGAVTAKMLRDIVHKNDGTRPVTSAIPSIQRANRSGFAEVLDVVGYNSGSAFSFDRDHQRYPGRKMVGSEFPHTVQTRGVYNSDENHCSSYDVCFGDATMEAGWNLLQQRPFVAGSFRWSGVDYMGEPSPHSWYHLPYRKLRWPSRSSETGVMDTCAFPKDAYYFYRSRWTDAPMLHLFPHWNWEGHEGEAISVWCYTNCDRVELYLNGRPMGMLFTSYTPDAHLRWVVNYEPGVLRAVGWNGERQVCLHDIRTAGKPDHILIHADKDRIRADVRDLVHITCRIVDAAGNPVPNASNRVRFEVEGPGRIVGVDNGDSASHESFHASQRKAFNGMCLAFVQAVQPTGSIHFTATSDGLTAAGLDIQVLS